MVAAVLVDHHAGQGRAVAAFAVDAALLARLNQACALQTLLDPGVTARAAVAAIPAVEMLDVPAAVPVSIAIGQCHHFVYWCAPVRYLLQPTVNQPVQAIGLVPRQIAPETTLAHPQ